MKLAIVCDWLTGIGGAEREVLRLHKLYPEAPIYTSQYDPKAIGWFKDADVRTTWLQHLPKRVRKFLPLLRAWAFSRLDLSGYDLVISVTGAEAKAVKTGPKTIHVCLCNAPTHYYWDRYDEYMAHPGFGLLDPLARLGLRVFVGPMRRWDYKAAQKPDYFIAISTHVKQLIKKYYGRDSKIIHSPVEIQRFKAKGRADKHGFIIAGRQTPYKRFDLAVAACTELDVPLTVIGNGPDHSRLVRMAGPRVSFLTSVADDEMPHYFQRAAAFIFPGVDDFGIVAVEALAAGTPVIAYGRGGALDYIKPGKNGVFFNQQNVNDLTQAITGFDSSKFNPARISKSAAKFSPEKFDKELEAYIKNLKLPKQETAD
jgi:glycosyltransferase involved in cell wall biosynthesis